MTRFTDKQIETMKKDIIGLKVADVYYEKEGDYYVMEFENGIETSFRFMADLIT